MTTVERGNHDPPTVFDSRRYGFSQAVSVRGGRRVHLSGQVGVDADGRTVTGGLAEQTGAAFDNVARVLADAGGTLADVAMLRISIVATARDELAAITAALLERFPDDPPAATWLLVSGLAQDDWLVEIEAEAALD